MCPADQALNQNATAPMRRALELARLAADAGEVPVGAVIVGAGGSIVAEAANTMRAARDPTAHAEMAAIRAACQHLGSERLAGHDLYVTLEPCAMCAAAISFARIRRLYFAAPDPKQGAVENGPRFYRQPACHHAPEVYGGLSEVEASTLMRRFFAARRD